jgi:hypothetical protein
MNLLQSFVELPAPIVASVTALIVGAVIFGVNWLIVRVPLLKFLANYAQEWGIVIAAALIMWFQSTVPDIYAAIAIHAVELVLAIIAVFSTLHTLAASRGVKGFTQ